MLVDYFLKEKALTVLKLIGRLYEIFLHTFVSYVCLCESEFVVALCVDDCSIYESCSSVMGHIVIYFDPHFTCVT